MQIKLKNLNFLSYTKHFYKFLITTQIYRISERSKENKNQLQKFQVRIQNVIEKINHLKDCKKQIPVFSAAKYPALKELENFHSLFFGKYILLLIMLLKVIDINKIYLRIVIVILICFCS